MKDTIDGPVASATTDPACTVTACNSFGTKSEIPPTLTERKVVASDFASVDAAFSESRSEPTIATVTTVKCMLAVG